MSFTWPCVLKGQQVDSPGQSEATPWVCGIQFTLPFACLAPATAGARQAKGKMRFGVSITQGGGREATLPWAVVSLPLRGVRNGKCQYASGKPEGRTVRCSAFDVRRSTFVSAEDRVLKGQPVDSPGQSAASPWVCGIQLTVPFACLAPATAGARQAKGKMRFGVSITQGGGREATLPWAIVSLPFRGVRNGKCQYASGKPEGRTVRCSAFDVRRSTFVSAEDRVLKGQQVDSPGQSAASPWVCGIQLTLPFSCLAPANGRRETGKGKMRFGVSVTQGGGREATLPWAIVSLPLRGVRNGKCQYASGKPEGRTVRRSTFDVRRSTLTFGVRRSAFGVRRSAFGVRRSSSAFDVRRSTFDVRRSAFDVRRSTFGVRRSAFGVRRSTFGVRRSAFDVRRSAFGVRRSAFDVRRSTFGVRRSAFDVRHSAFDVRAFDVRRSTFVSAEDRVLKGQQVDSPGSRPAAR